MKRKMSFLVIGAMLAGLTLSACGDKGTENESPGATPQNTQNSGETPNSGENEPITFEWFIPDPNAKIPPDDAPIMQQVFDKTGVRFKRLIPPAEPEERLNLMLASDELPDLITFYNPSIMEQYKAANKLLKLNDLLAQYAPNTFNLNWEIDVKGKIADDNGDFWFIPSGYSFGKTEIEADISVNVRTDYFDEKGYNVPKTLAEYADLLRNVHAWNPDIIPLGLALGPIGHIDELVMTGAAINGLNYDWANFILDENTDKLIHYSQSPAMKAFFKFLNGLNEEGLVDPESPIMSKEMLKQKAVAKQIWSFLGPGWEINSEAIAYEMSIDSLEQSIGIFPVADDSVKAGTYAPYSINMFATGMCLTHKNKDPERFMKFYEYANTEEGWMTLNGIINFDFTGENTIEATDGYDYIVRKDVLKDGKPIFEASAWMGYMWGKDENWHWNRGVESMGSFTYNGFTETHPNSDYAIAFADVSVWWDENSKRINNLLGWKGTEYFSKMAELGVDNSSITALTMSPEMPEYTQNLAVTKTHKDMLPRVIMAPSAEAFETEWNAYTAELEKQGLAAVMARYNQLYQARKEKWDLAE